MSKTIWYTRCPVASCTGVAIENRLFDQAFAATGYGVRNIRDKEGVDLDTHYDHRLEDSFREGGAIPPIWARSRGADTVLAGLTYIEDDLCFYVHADSDIATFDDLAGRRIAVPHRPEILIDFMRINTIKAIDGALHEHGLTRGDVQLIDLDISGNLHEVINPSNAGDGFETSMFQPELDALSTGAVDVIFAKNGQTGYLERNHAQQLRRIYNLRDARDPNNAVNGNPRLITVSRGLTEQDPEAVIRYLTVLLQAAAWAGRHRDETVAIIAGEAGVSPRDVEVSYPRNVHETLWPTLDPQRCDYLRHQVEFLVDEQFIEPFDVEGWMNPELLDEAYRRAGSAAPGYAGAA